MYPIEEDMLATEDDAEREYTWNVGRERSDSEWILSDRDVWYRNPFYTGPKGRHPEDNDECYNDDELRELAFIDQFCPEAECDAMPF